MKLTKEMLLGLKQEFEKARDKAQQDYFKQVGAINFCEWMLEKVEFEGEKEDKNGLVN